MTVVLSMSIRKITVQSVVPKTLIMRHGSLGISSVFLVSLQKDKRKLVCVSTIRQVIVIELFENPEASGDVLPQQACRHGT
uniref:Uncharacterized protein n=1 Tax=Caudovirales sp. ct2KA10 TaxID=2825757 RepID=A0A8S5U4P6_9CAUD|nr:MAG TPA: hypothetical protein [Caudovirales sp. ct2KA10]